MAACLTPTDPVLAASILSNSQFSTRVPKRIKDMLSAESGCNDGIILPLPLHRPHTPQSSPQPGGALKEWFLITILWQCVFGTFHRPRHRNLFQPRPPLQREQRLYRYAPAYTVFYLLLAILSIGVGSILGSR